MEYSKQKRLENRPREILASSMLGGNVESQLKLLEYESLKEKNKQLKCDKCKHVWLLEDATIHFESVKNENGQEMLVHFFLCPKCNEIYIVDIIDTKVRMYLEKIKKLEKKISRMQKHNEAAEEVRKRNQIKQLLLQHEKALKNKYSKYFYLRT